MSISDSERGSITIDKISDIDKERFFKVALNEENEFNSLLAYYRDRINEIDGHREEWLDKYNKVRTPQDEAHKQTWELQKRKDEIVELKAILDEEKLKLYNERQEIIDLIKENDLLKIKEVEDRKKISELGLLGDQIEQEIVFYKDAKPETINRYMKNDLSLRTNSANYEAMLKKTEGKENAQKIANAQKTNKGVVKTMYLPNDHLNSVAMENDELRKALEENRLACLEKVEKLREDLRNRENELSRIYEHSQEQINDYLKKNQILEKDNINLVKDYFELILQSNELEKKLNEENELLRLKNAAIANKLRIQMKKAKLESQASTKFVDKKTEEFSNRYRQEIKQKETDLALIKEQYAQIQNIYIQKMKELEQHLTKLSSKHSALEKRRLLENEGFRTDVKKMRNQVLAYQKYIERLDLVEADNTEESERLEEAKLSAKEELTQLKKQISEVESRLDKARRIKS